MDDPFITSTPGILTVLSGVCAFFFFLEKSTRWRLFQYLPPLVFIYIVPVCLSNADVIPTSSPVYDTIKTLFLPMMLVLMLLKVDVLAATRVLGPCVAVMLFGTLGVIIGAPIGLLLVGSWLGPEAWKAFGTLAGSWIGGTGNMSAVSVMIGTSDVEFGLAVLADASIYMIWLPLLLASKGVAGWFGRFTGVSSARLSKMDAAIETLQQEKKPPSFDDYLYLLFLAAAVTWLTDLLANELPAWEPYLSRDTWHILLITTAGICLSFTPLRKLAGSHELAMALVYLFVARMGAIANFSGVASQAVPFLIGAVVWILIHGGFCLLGAKLFRVDVHIAAIASAANIGGAASATIVAAHHKERLVPLSILMALIGYAVGNYAAYFTAVLCYRIVNL